MEDKEDGPSDPKKSRSSREVLRNVLDGVVDPDILDSCVEDLQLITTQSGTKLCDLVQASQHSRDAKEAAEAAAATAIAVEGQGDEEALERKQVDSKDFPGAAAAMPSVSTIIPTDGASHFRVMLYAE